MNDKNSSLKELLPKRTLEKNKPAIKAFNLYKKTAIILEQAYLASGRKSSFQTSTGSAQKTQVNLHGISSTQKI